MECVVCTLLFINDDNDIIDEYIYRTPYNMLLTEFIEKLDIIIKSIFSDDKYTCYLINNLNDKIDYKKLNKLINFNKKITVFQKIFNSKCNKIKDFKLVIRENIL